MQKLGTHNPNSNEKKIVICFGAMVALAANAQVTFKTMAADERSNSYLLQTQPVHVDGNTIIENGGEVISSGSHKKSRSERCVLNGVIKLI
jgi:hypothetical protein